VGVGWDEPRFAPALHTTAHGMGSGSALRLSGMTKRWGWAIIFELSDCH
jgi:hypothetical protein